MKAKKLITAMSSIFMAGLALTTAGCGGGGSTAGDINTLEIFCVDAGYGVEWVDDMVALFKQQAWVQEKYPELVVTVSSNDDQTFAQSRLDAGAKANSLDLLFGMNMWGYAGEGSNALDLTEVVYNQKVPGEDVLYKDKLDASYLASNTYVKTGSNQAYYTASWVGGMASILYNEDLYQANGYTVPNTTDELIQVCADYKAKGHYSFIQSFDAPNYFDYLFYVWWGQYEGIEGYNNFFNGIDNDTYSSRIFNQKGREYALEVFEALLDYDKGYLNPKSTTQKFVIAQTSFIEGEALMHLNGDWFSSEMADIMALKGANAPKIKTMRVPIVSKLGEKLGITDAELSAAVDYVDALGEGETPQMPAFHSTKSYSAEKIIATVKEARSVVYSIGASHQAIIPNYALAKDIAVDFIRFMATDIALESYTKATCGSNLPFNYEVPKAVYDTLPLAQQSRIDYFANKNGVYTLIAPQYFPLVRYGGLTPFVDEQYYTTFSVSGNTKTAADFMKETKDAWTEQKFSNALGSAGLK